MDNQLHDALIDYLTTGTSPMVYLNRNGLYYPPSTNTCPLCENAQWSCGTGAHLRQPEHYALKHGIDVKLFLRACSPLSFVPSNIGWKRVRYIENSYLVSNGGFKWLPNEVTYAECSTCDDVPGTDCSCGLYFFWSPLEAIKYGDYEIVIKCEIGGDVIEATKGCRAECAVIRGVYYDLDDTTAQEIADIYQVPVITNLLEDYDVRPVDEL